jgi:hypothetical protein
MRLARARRGRQGGATAVEFALTLLIFLAFFLGILDFSRLLYLWSAASEAARAAARYAVVCDDTGRADLALARARALLPQVQSLAVQWEPPACDPSTCQAVTVRISGLDSLWISPLAGAASLARIRLPEVSAYLPREIMRRDLHSEELCKS